MDWNQLSMRIAAAVPYVSLFIAAMILGLLLLTKSRAAGVLMLLGGIGSLLVLLIRGAFMEYTMSELNGGNPGFLDGWVYRVFSLGCVVLQVHFLACFLAAAMVGRGKASKRLGTGSDT